MAGSSETRAGNEETEPLLPEDSALSIAEYLDMQRAIGNEIRFRVLDLLVESGAHSAKELALALEVPSNTLHYHLDELVDVGLVENRKRKERDESGLYSYYRATSPGRGILEHGVRELMREEWELVETYGG